jgi:hypothetical protein
MMCGAKCSILRKAELLEAGLVQRACGQREPFTFVPPLFILVVALSVVVLSQVRPRPCLQPRLGICVD